MFEKLLTHFVSEDTKMVLAAMEKYGALELTSWKCESAADEMCGIAKRYGSLIDRAVLRLARRRLGVEKVRRKDIAHMRDTAGKLLMGDTYEEEKATQTTFHLGQMQAQAQVLAQVMNQQAQGRNQATQLGAYGGQAMMQNSLGRP